MIRLDWVPLILQCLLLAMPGVLIRGGSSIRPAQRHGADPSSQRPLVINSQAEWRYLADTPGAPDVMVAQQPGAQNWHIDIFGESLDQGVPT